MRLLILFMLCLFTEMAQTQDFTISQYDLGSDLNDAQLMQFAETADGQVYFLYFYFESGGRDHRLQVFDGSTWTPISRPCESCINQIVGHTDGQLYAAADDEILRYNPTDDSWSTYLDQPAFALLTNSAGTITFINGEGTFDYDGTTISARNNMNLPTISIVNQAVYAPNGDLYAIVNSQFYRQDADGWTALSDVTSPLHLALAPDGKVYVADNFGGIHYYENQVYTSNALPGVFPSFFGLQGLGISEEGVFWGSTQGTSPSLVRHEPPSTTASIPTTDLIPDAILINDLFVASNNLVFVVSDFRTYVTTVDDGTATSIFQLERPTLDFAVSPNPSEGQMKIQWDQLPAGNGTVEIFNALGQPCYREIIEIVQTEGQLDIVAADLPSGNYWLVLRVGSHLGRQQITVK
ncbi:MAG: T9SS type A sorting domain-containing protein [Bacteroidota bacterium]